MNCKTFLDDLRVVSIGMILSHFLRFQYNGVCFNGIKLSVYVIVFVCSQYDGGIMFNRTIAYIDPTSNYL